MCPSRLAAKRTRVRRSGFYPPHLAKYIVAQDYAQYTSEDQAAWRFIMRLSRSFFQKHSVSVYLDGLKKTGIPIDHIPKVSEMNRLLRRFGWRAVAVRGFIPPSVFMEFQARHTLPISCDMRTLQHLNYTPAPDIVHEAAGHAPIIADPDYSNYLKSYAEVAFKAIRSDYDLKLFEAIRSLSDIKEAIGVSEQTIAEAERRLEAVLDEGTHFPPSEAALMARMNWWTVEYGLVGNKKRPRIYGAGLLSSLGESQACLGEEVKKIPFSVECVNYAYDITRPQPQLFVAKNFKQLRRVLWEFAEQMAFRQGGYRSLVKAVESKTVNTVQLDSGLEISGKLFDVVPSPLTDPKRVDFLRFGGPVQLSYKGRVLPHQSIEEHAQGFSSPLGQLSGHRRPVWKWTPAECQRVGWRKGATVRLSFTSGFDVEGKIIGTIRSEDRLLILRFQDCTVRRGAETFFRPEWGVFDLALGETVVSVFSGAADRESYGDEDGAEAQIDFNLIQQSNRLKKKKPLLPCYTEIRRLREKGKVTVSHLSKLWEKIQSLDREEWLAPLEVLELCVQRAPQADLEKEIRAHLRSIQVKQPGMARTIERGLQEIHQS